MSIAKVVEISCESEESFEDAISQGIHGAAKTVHNIKGGWVQGTAGFRGRQPDCEIPGRSQG